MADNLLIVNGGLATVNGSLATDAGGAPCCCGSGPGQCECRSDPRCQGGTNHYQESFIRWDHPADPNVPFTWIRDTSCCYDGSDWTASGTYAEVAVSQDGTERSETYIDYSGGGAAGVSAHVRVYHNGSVVADFVTPTGWTPCNWGVARVPPVGLCVPNNLSLACSSGEILQTTSQSEGWWFASPAPGGGTHYASWNARLDADPHGTCRTQDCGACCDPDGFCFQTDSTACAAILGRFYRGVACPDSPCINGVRGACCLADGSCSMLSFTECDRRHGSWHPNRRCGVDVQCPQPLGICCCASGCIGRTTRADCEEQGTCHWYANATDCSVCNLPPPSRPCCFPDGSCDVLTGADCIARGGTWQQNGTTCEAAGCQPQTGACCYMSSRGEECIDGETLAACLALNQGQWQGAGTTCANTACGAGIRGPTNRLLGIGGFAGHGPGGLL